MAEIPLLPIATNLPRESGSMAGIRSARSVTSRIRYPELPTSAKQPLPQYLPSEGQFVAGAIGQAAKTVSTIADKIADITDNNQRIKTTLAIEQDEQALAMDAYNTYLRNSRDPNYQGDANTEYKDRLNAGYRDILNSRLPGIANKENRALVELTSKHRFITKTLHDAQTEILKNTMEISEGNRIKEIAKNLEYLSTEGADPRGIFDSIRMANAKAGTLSPDRLAVENLKAASSVQDGFWMSQIANSPADAVDRLSTNKTETEFKDDYSNLNLSPEKRIQYLGMAKNELARKNMILQSRVDDARPQALKTSFDTGIVPESWVIDQLNLRTDKAKQELEEAFNVAKMGSEYNQIKYKGSPDDVEARLREIVEKHPEGITSVKQLSPGWKEGYSMMIQDSSVMLNLLRTDSGEAWLQIGLDDMRNSPGMAKTISDEIGYPIYDEAHLRNSDFGVQAKWLETYQKSRGIAEPRLSNGMKMKFLTELNSFRSMNDFRTYLDRQASILGPDKLQSMLPDIYSAMKDNGEFDLTGVLLSAYGQEAVTPGMTRDVEMLWKNGKDITEYLSGREEGETKTRLVKVQAEVESKLSDYPGIGNNPRLYMVFHNTLTRAAVPYIMSGSSVSDAVNKVAGHFIDDWQQNIGNALAPKYIKDGQRIQEITPDVYNKALKMKRQELPKFFETDPNRAVDAAGGEFVTNGFTIKTSDGRTYPPRTAFVLNDRWGIPVRNEKDYFFTPINMDLFAKSQEWDVRYRKIEEERATVESVPALF